MMINMFSESAVKQAREKFKKRKEEIEREHQALEKRIRKEKEARLAKSAQEFRKEFCLTIKQLLGEEDWLWLTQWLAAKKEKETEDAENRYESERAEELRKMNSEDYLFRYLSDPIIKKKLDESESNKPEDTERLVSIVSKLRLEKVWVNGTLV